MEALPDDPGRWIDLGRLLGHLGWTEESETALAKARSLLERRLSRAPDDEAAAAALAGVLPDADESRGWTILQPEVMTSAAGATLTRLPDGSVLAGGRESRRRHLHGRGHDRPRRDHRAAARGHPRPELAAHGPGRDPDRGNFHPGRDPPEHASPGRSARDPGPPDPGPRRLLGRRPRLRGVERRPRHGPVHGWLVDLAARTDLTGPSSRPTRPIGTRPGTRLRVELVCGERVAA